MESAWWEPAFNLQFELVQNMKMFVLVWQTVQFLSNIVALSNTASTVQSVQCVYQVIDDNSGSIIFASA